MKNLLVFFLALFIFCNSVFANTPSPVSNAAILIDRKTGRILYAKNEHTPLKMASTTKIMTAILAIENCNLDDIVTVSQNATKAPKTKMFLKEGEQIKLKELLYGLMLESANDAAIAIAEHVSGSVEAFCDLMTEKAKQIGAKNTSFETPNGLDSENHYSTAYDMAIITKYALENETFLAIINTNQVSFNTDKSSYSLVNKNRLLKEYAGADGVKTGYTGGAGHCFVGSATRDNLALISVVLGAGYGNSGKEQKWIDTKELLNYGFENYEYKTVLKAEDFCEKAKVYDGIEDFVEVYLKEDIILPLTDEEEEILEIKVDILDNLKAPIYKNMKVGTVSILLNGEVLKTANLLAKNSVEKETFSYNFDKIVKEWLNTIN